MQKNSITNKITPCCGLPFSVVYWWVSNLTLNSESDRQYLLTQISQNGLLSIDGWKVLINSGTLEADASLTKADFLAWFDCGKQPKCEQLKIIIEGFKISNWDANAQNFAELLQSFEDFKNENILKYNDLEENIAENVIVRVKKNTGENINYLKINNWFDGSQMTNEKVDGIIFVKIGNEYYLNSNWLSTKTIVIDEIQDQITDAEKFEKAIAVVKSLNGGKVKFSKNLNFDKKIIISDVRGLVIEGVNARYSLEGGNFNGATINFTNKDDYGIEILGFVDLTVNGVNFKMLQTNADDGKLLSLVGGYDFSLNNLKFRAVGNKTICLSLGKNSGETCAFQGQINRVSTVQEGGIGIFSGETNTSLSFNNCYVRGAQWEIKGTVYSTFNSCACDGSYSDGYYIHGGANSKAHTLTFISCGAEAARKSGFKIGSGVYNITFISPHGGLNNTDYYTDIGELFTLDNDGIYQQESVTIINPVSVNKNYQVVADIYGTSARCADLTLISVYAESLAGGIKGFSYWISDKVTEIGKDIRTAKLTYRSQGFRGGLMDVQKMSIIREVVLEGNETYFYPKTDAGQYLVKGVRIIAIAIKIENTSGVSVTVGDGFPEPILLVSNINDNTINKIGFPEAVVKSDNFGLRFNGTFGANAKALVEILFEKII